MIWALDGLLAALRPPWPAFHSIEARSIHPSSRQRWLVVVFFFLERASARFSLSRSRVVEFVTS